MWGHDMSETSFEKAGALLQELQDALAVADSDTDALRRAPGPPRGPGGPHGRAGQRHGDTLTE